MQWGGMRLAAFDSLPEMERAEMIAHVRIRGLMEAHASKVSQEISDREAGKSQGGTRQVGNFRPGAG